MNSQQTVVSSNKNRIKKTQEKGKITVSRVYKSDFQKEGTETAELKQTIVNKSYYPSKSVENSLQDNIFSAEDFGFEEQEFINNETRVAWIDVPTGTTAAQVQAKLDAMEDISLYKILSNKPILTDQDQYAIGNPDLDVTLDSFAERQVVRYGEESENAGKLALDQYGKIQYRRVAFSKVAKEDMDVRTTDPSDFYASATLKSELAGTVTNVSGQSL